MTAFVEAVRDGYTQGGRVSNPFHCFRHGFDVFQVVSALVSGDTLQVNLVVIILIYIVTITTIISFAG